MFVNKIPQSARQGRLRVTLEPLPGHFDREVVSELRAVGADSIEVVAPGFVSAIAPESALDRLRAVALVHIKAEKALRSLV
jgi:hypothetical protein